MLLQDLGNNAIFSFSETRSKEDDSEELWQLSKDFFKTFRSDRKTSLKDKGGGVTLVVPKSLNPKLRKDLNHLNKESFESLWVECNLTNDAANKCEQLINIIYNQDIIPKNVLSILSSRNYLQALTLQSLKTNQSL